MFATRLFTEGSVEVGVGNYVWVVLAIFFLMVFLGWLVANKGWLRQSDERTQPGPNHDVHVSVSHQEPAQKNIEIAIADDLTLIEGIGQKVARVLASINITSFRDLASADHTKVRGALDAAGYKYMDPGTWYEQAQLASEGKMDELKKLQDSLKGGRKL